MPILMDSQNRKIHPAMAGLMSEIQEFLDTTGMGSSYFGRVSVGNTELLARLRLGSEIRRGTEQRVLDYIKAERIKRAEFPDVDQPPPEGAE